MNVAIFLADGFEEIEALTVVDLLRRANISIDTISMNSSTLVTGGHDIILQADLIWEEKDCSCYDLLVIPGGLGGVNALKHQQAFLNLLENFNDQGKIIAAICAGPSILGMLNIAKGKKVTCYPGFEKEMLGAMITKGNVVRDQNLITSRGMGTSIEFALSIIELIQTKEASDTVRKAILFET